MSTGVFRARFHPPPRPVPVTAFGTITPAIAYWNPLDAAAAWSFSENNLRASGNSATGVVRSNWGHTTGKWYIEHYQNSGVPVIGFATASQGLTTTYSTNDTAAWYKPADTTTPYGWVWGNNGWRDFTANTQATGSWIALAIDLDAGLFWIRTASGWVGDPAAGTGGYSCANFSGLEVFPALFLEGAADVTTNFGEQTFAYTAPSGFNAWYESPVGITAEAGVFTLTGAATTLKAARRLTAAAGDYTLTGGATSLERGFKVAADSGSFTLTGEAVALKVARKLAADAGAFTLAGGATSLERGFRIAGDAAAYNLTGADALVNFGGRLEAGSGAFTLEGGDATFTVAAGTTSLHGRRIKERKPNRRGKVIVFPDELPPEPELEAPVAPKLPDGPLGIGEAVKALTDRLAALQAQKEQAEAVARQRRRQQARIDTLKAEIGRVEIELQAAVEAEHAWIARLRDEDEWLLLAA